MNVSRGFEKRQRVGRPKGSGRYGEKTRLVRVPESLIPQIYEMLDSFWKESELGCKLQDLALLEDVGTEHLDDFGD